jgi:hypothetical protein
VARNEKKKLRRHVVTVETSYCGAEMDVCCDRQSAPPG